MSSRFTAQTSPLEGATVLQRSRLEDDRGHLERFFCSEELGAFLKGRTIHQVNHTLTKKSGTLRGMHFQHPPAAETKIVTCLKGEVFDVALDLRRESKTFLQWYGVHLSEKNGTSFIIPEGFAHGFQALSDNCELLYFHTHKYESKLEDGLNPLDPKLAIKWPLAARDLSLRDSNFALLSETFEGLKV